MSGKTVKADCHSRKRVWPWEEVWSAVGPVLWLAVWPEPEIQSKSPEWSLVHVHSPLSKLQLPANTADSTGHLCCTAEWTQWYSGGTLKWWCGCTCIYALRWMLDTFYYQSILFFVLLWFLEGNLVSITWIRLQCYPTRQCICFIIWLFSDTILIWQN